MKFLNNINKTYLWIGAGVLLLLLVVLLSVRIFSGGAGQEITPVALMPTQPFVLSTPTVSPVVTAETQASAPGNIWVVSKTKVDKVKIGKYSYIVDEFTNEAQPSLIMRAHCAAPGAPAPEVGQKYLMNDFEVLVPVEGVDSPLQRFFPMP